MCEVSFPNVLRLANMTPDPGLELANVGIIEKVAPLYGIEKRCGGVGLMGFCLSAGSI